MTASASGSIKFRWLRGYVRSPVVEIAITTIFSALVIVTRAFQVPLLPPLVVGDLAGAFSYTPASLVSFPMCFVFVILNTVTAPNPFLAFFAWIVSIPLVNLAAKLTKRFAIWTPLLGPYIGITVFSYVSQVFGGKLFLATFSAAAIRATANFLTIILLSPVIWKAFERMGILQKD